MTYCFLFIVPQPQTSTLFPYTTLFRSPRDLGQDLEQLAREHPALVRLAAAVVGPSDSDRKSTRLNSSHRCISYAVFCLKKKSPLSRSAAGAQDQRPAQERSA